MPLGSEDQAPFKPGEVLVKFREEAPARSVDSLRTRFEATRLATLEGVDVQVWQVPEGRELDITEQLKAEPAIEYAQPNYVYYALGIPNDPGFSQQWGLTKVRAPQAWDVTKGSDAVTIAIVDSGIDLGHPDLAGKIVAGWDYVDSDSVPQDENGHGTHVAGIAAAMTNNGVGVAGMSWNAKIMPVRVLNRYGQGYTDQIAAGILWAAQHGAKVINLSLGGVSYDATMQDAINQAYNAGCLVVAAMGNCRTGCEIGSITYINPTMYPAADLHVMAVAATGPSDGYAFYSQYGSHCDIAAPGGDMYTYHDPDGIYSTMPTYDVDLTTDDYFYKHYDFLHGTSQATPFVAGLAALVWATNPSLSPDQVQGIIQDTAVDLGSTGWDPTFGWGRIDALAAVSPYGPPAAPVIESIDNPDGDGSYQVNWNDISTATNYELQEDSNFQFSSATTMDTGSTSEYSVSGRAAGPWYYRVRVTTSAGTSPWSEAQSVSVTTYVYMPLILRSLTIKESFDSGVMPPPGWSRIVFDTNTLTTTWYIDSDHPYSPPYDAACDYDPTGAQQDEVLLSPPFQLTTASVSFYSQGSVYYCRDDYQRCSLDVWLVVGEMDNVNDIFVYRANQDWLGTYVWSPSFVDLTPYLPADTPVRVAFQYYGKNGAQISLDSIVISGN